MEQILCNVTEKMTTGSATPLRGRLNHWCIYPMVTCCMVVNSGLLQAAVPAPTRTVEVPVLEDAGVIQILTAPNNGGDATFLLSDRVSGEFDHNFMRFDLKVLPKDAVITSAKLQLNISAFENPLTVHEMELGRVEEAWSEGGRVIAGTLSMAAIDNINEPVVTWLGTVASIDKTGDLHVEVKQTVQDWRDGVYADFGLVVRGVTPDSGQVLADTREGDVAPVLRVSYEIPEREGAVSDVGDAPDSSNHHGLNNTAYPGDGTLGQFPTVRDPRMGMSFGPFHTNPTLEGYLGDHISTELEADMLADEDIANNILLNSHTGVLADVANMDHGDDGWRNRNIGFNHCSSELLQVRISRDEDAQVLGTMYLNAWFDGNRDGDWGDPVHCQQSGGGAAMAQEWIVQDVPIDLQTIDPGGFLDLNISSQLVANLFPQRLGWVRFMLSDEPLVPKGQAPDPWPDGQAPAGGFGYGETEDYVYRPSPEATSAVVLTHEVLPPLDGVGMTPYHYIYKARLYNWSNETISASMDSELDPFMHLYRLLNAPGTPDGSLTSAFIYTGTGGVTPLLGYHASNSDEYDILPHPRPDFGTYLEESVGWSGTLEPDTEVLLQFKAAANYKGRQVWPCAAGQESVLIPSLVTATIEGSETREVWADAELTCFYDAWSQ